MGLDMYMRAELYASDYIGKDHMPLVASLGIEWPGDTKAAGFESCTISRTVAYWRKANQVHQWFVTNCQDGEDDCRKAYVSTEQLTELRDLCRTLLASRDPKEAAEKLPPQSGFFFGGTEIDDYYWQDIEETDTQLTAILDHPNREHFSFYYESSW